jgi:hypothetical protein
MRAESILFAILGIFLGGTAVVYWYTSEDPTGTTALVLSCGLGLLIAYYSYLIHRRIGYRPSDLGDADITDGAGEFGFFSPHSWWPLIAAGSAATVALGMVFGWWLMVMGVAALLYGTVGMLFEYEPRRSQQH